MSSILFFTVLLCTGAGLSAQENQPATALTPAQRQTLRQIAQSAEKETKIQAEAAGRQMGEIAKRIDLNLLSDTPDDALHAKLSTELANAVVTLVRAAIAAKLNTARDLVKVLTPEQKKLVIAELNKPGANPDLTELLGKIFAEPKK